MAEFFDVTLADVVDFFNGKAIKPGQEGDYPAYGSNGLIGGSSEWKYDNSIVIGRVGAYCGSVAYCKSRFWASDNTIVAKPKSGDVRYFYYLLKELGLNRYAGGAAQPLVTQTVLKGVPARIPDVSTQRRIASILSAYDDLIENNTRRIAILEEMARRIYEEWFVRFRFPGHEQVKMVESELGLIPEGWGIAPFTELFDVRYGKTLPTKNLCSDGKYPVYGGGGVIGRHDEYVVPGPTCLITSRGNGSGTVWRTTEQAFVTNNSFVVVPKGRFAGASHGFAQLFSSYSPIKTVLGGAAQPQLTLDGLASLRVVGCPSELCLEADSLIQPMFNLANKLHEKNANLRATRDLLLPKLISGELNVSHLHEPEGAISA
ncbi:restriction endonuclease subunit S [Neopusillimonas aromaticivorans]|uniref:restriction endonuclease subunit S n=1 Tax=Neopusillimonas aromaticivorans TaxID=2979868 RepID=UPI00259AD9DE|nr:restriction endonuclease subunit S [Neopusillimonas aromaticivorans]WJJ93975.1 restriction endonuclease subunit S [Neopusillimonas aromaticivorans]